MSLSIDAFIRACPKCEAPLIYTSRRLREPYTCIKCGETFTHSKMIPTYRADIEIRECAKCGDVGESKTLHVHHIDKNHRNNDKENLLVLCQKCHRELHHDKWKLSDIGILNDITYCTSCVKNETDVNDIEYIRRIKRLSNATRLMYGI